MRKLFYFVIGVSIAVVLGVWMYQARAASTLVPGGLVGYWKFDEGSASTTLDSSGNGNTGTLTNFSSSTVWVDSRVGLNKALNFDGVNDYVSVGSGASLDNIRTLTISAWIYPRSYGSGAAPLGRIIDKNQASNGWILFLCQATANCSGTVTNSFKFVQGFSTTGGFWTATSNSISLNTWTHIAITYNNPSGLTTVNPLMYVNGGAVSIDFTSNGTGTIADDSAITATIGARNSDTLRQFDGLIDDVRVYNRVLSAAEIQRLYSLRRLGGQGISR